MLSMNLIVAFISTPKMASKMPERVCILPRLCSEFYPDIALYIRAWRRRDSQIGAGGALKCVCIMLFPRASVVIGNSESLACFCELFDASKSDMCSTFDYSVCFNCSVRLILIP